GGRSLERDTVLAMEEGTVLNMDVLQSWTGCFGLDAPAGCAVRVGDGLVLAVLIAGLLAAVTGARRLIDRLATLRATAWSPVLSRLLSRWVRARHYTEDAFYSADGAGEPWIGRRRDGLARLAGQLRDEYPVSRGWAESIRDGFSDLRFTDANRVPLAFA